jgi:alpha-tubulin suppressor-like RCC1 family protein
LLGNGTARCWGEGGSGRLGNGATANQHTPVTVTSFAAGTSISAGGSHTCAVRSTGGVRCWGGAGNGRLGNDVQSGNQTTPVSPVGLSS